MRSTVRSIVSLIVLTAAVSSVSVGCRSDLRGNWEGTFDGNVSGTVQMTINSRGTKCRGGMVGVTASGQPFEAKLQGSLDRGVLSATFRGDKPQRRRAPSPFLRRARRRARAQRRRIRSWPRALAGRHPPRSNPHERHLGAPPDPLKRCQGLRKSLQDQHLRPSHKGARDFSSRTRCGSPELDTGQYRIVVHSDNFLMTLDSATGITYYLTQLSRAAQTGRSLDRSNRTSTAQALDLGSPVPTIIKPGRLRTSVDSDVKGDTP